MNFVGDFFFYDTMAVRLDDRDDRHAYNLMTLLKFDDLELHVHIDGLLMTSTTSQ